MKILYVASEAVPFIASGGLADVAGSLPKALNKNGMECCVVIPFYSGIKEELKQKAEYIKYFYVPLGWRNQYCGLFKYELDGVTYYLLDNEYYFKRSSIYGYFDDAERFMFFSKAVLEMLVNIDFCPDIISCNDWQTAMIPVFLNIFYRNVEKLRYVRTTFTIHNIAYQGRFDLQIAKDIAGIPDRYLSMVEYDKDINMMKGAIEQADMITTVSPTYSHEILDSWYGFGLDRILREKQYKLCGILNGIDTDVHNPMKDTNIYEKFSAKNLKGKAKNKECLQRDLGLEIVPNKPIICIISRLVAMKGLDLVRYIFDGIMAQDVQFVILGTGDYLYESFFNEMGIKYKGKVAFRNEFSQPLSKKIYASSDILLMPSKSEPCGLAQMIALQYGTLPIVRETGGLCDSIKDLGGENGNGFTFKTYNAHDMLDAVIRAVDLYRHKPEWEKAVKKSMQSDFSWESSAKQYIDMYKRVLEN